MSTSPSGTLPPFAPATVSLALYADPGEPRAMLEQVFAQARAAEHAGVDGVTVSEHHAGFAPYLPNPIQVAGWILDRTARVWAGPCPLLLPLRPTALVVEELSWMGALHPGRLGVGVAPGYVPADFDVFGLDPGNRATHFAEQLPALSAALAGRGDGLLRQDPAVAATVAHPVPLVVAAGSATAARRAARAGAGILTDSMGTIDRIRAVFRAYADSGGTGPRMLNRRIWLGDPPAALVAQQQAQYRAAAGGDAWMAGSDMRQLSGDPATLGRALVDIRRETGADHLGLKVHVPGLEPEVMKEQIDGLADVLLAMREAVTLRGGL